MKKVLTGVAIVLGLCFLQRCTYDKEMRAPSSSCPDTINVSFAARVRPLLQANCFSCHANGASAGNVSLDTYDKVQQVALSGRLLGSISHSPGFAPMPVGAGKLGDCNITAVRTWILEGSRNN